MRGFLGILVALLGACGSQQADPPYCTRYDLNRGVAFRFDSSFTTWIEPHGTRSLWDRAASLAPLAFNDKPTSSPIVLEVKMSWLDRPGNADALCTAQRNQAYTHAGDSTIYICPFLNDAVDGAGTDPWTGSYGYGARARLLAHEALHGLACRADHLVASQQGIMCGTPFAPPVSCSKGLRQFTAADKAYGCGQWASEGFCARALGPMEAM